jgi:hypothetical protein
MVIYGNLTCLTYGEHRLGKKKVRRKAQGSIIRPKNHITPPPTLRSDIFPLLPYANVILFMQPIFSFIFCSFCIYFILIASVFPFSFHFLTFSFTFFPFFCPPPTLLSFSQMTPAHISSPGERGRRYFLL